jgi:hypothetical protein
MGGALSLNFNPFKLLETTPSNTPLLQWEEEKCANSNGSALLSGLQSFERNLQIKILKRKHLLKDRNFKNLQ